jgi:hypothetical protein
MKKQLILLTAFACTSLIAIGQTTYDTFNGGPKLVKYIMKSGKPNANGLKVANPKKDKVNPSDSCLQYVRKATEKYDFLKMNTVGKLVDVTPYVEGSKKMTLLVYSPAAGIKFEIFLQDGTLAEQDYPKGRHSGYSATTSEENKWELLTFEFVFQPDETVDGKKINQILLQVAGGTNDGGTYYIDDLTGPNIAK